MAVAVGCRVRIRGLHGQGHRHLPRGIKGDDADRVIAIVPPGEVGLYRLSPRMPLAGALLGHLAGDVVEVAVQAATVRFEVLAVEPDASGVVVVVTERAARVGDVVHVQDGHLEEWWRIVPPEEADASRRLISEETPMARALLGHRAGEVVQVQSPGSARGWPVTIVAVEAIGAQR